MLILKFQADKSGTPCCRPDLFYDCALTPEDCKHTSYDVECNRYRYCEPNLCLIEDAASSELPWEREREKEQTCGLFFSQLYLRDGFVPQNISDCFFFNSRCNDAPSMHPVFFFARCNAILDISVRHGRQRFFSLHLIICKVFVDVLWYLMIDFCVYQYLLATCQINMIVVRFPL